MEFLDFYSLSSSISDDCNSLDDSKIIIYLLFVSDFESSYSDSVSSKEISSTLSFVIFTYSILFFGSIISSEDFNISYRASLSYDSTEYFLNSVIFFKSFFLGCSSSKL